MAQTGQQLLRGLSEFINDSFLSTVTGAGATDGSTVLDTTLQRWDDGALEGAWVRITGTASGTQYQTRRIVDFSGSTLTVAPAFSDRIDATETYEIHRHEVERKFDALDASRFEVFDDLFQIVRDDTTTGDGKSAEFPIPAGMPSGVIVAMVEAKLSANAGGNVLYQPQQDSLTGWTAAGGVVAALQSRDSIRDIVPKYSTASTKLVYTDTGANGTYTQVVGDMNTDFTAVRASGRQMEAAMWVYDQSSGVVLRLIDNTGTVVTSTAHTGTGWELLRAKGVVRDTNTTVLSVQLVFTTSGSDHRTVYVNGAFLAFVQVPEIFHADRAIDVIRDDALNVFRLREVIREGLQIRLVGKEPLDPLGTTLATQVTNTMEVDAPQAQLIYGTAALILIGDDVFNSNDLRTVNGRITIVERRRADLKKLWPYQVRRGRWFSPYQL